MSTEEAKRKKQALIIVGAILLALLIAGGIYTILRQRKQLNDIQSLAEIEKQELQEQYNEVALQYEGFKIEVSNDSILHQLESEKATVQRLLEELRTVKSTNCLLYTSRCV